MTTTTTTTKFVSQLPAAANEFPSLRRKRVDTEISLDSDFPPLIELPAAPTFINNTTSTRFPPRGSALLPLLLPPAPLPRRKGAIRRKSEVTSPAAALAASSGPTPSTIASRQRQRAVSELAPPTELDSTPVREDQAAAGTIWDKVKEQENNSEEKIAKDRRRQTVCAAVHDVSPMTDAGSWSELDGTPVINQMGELDAAFFSPPALQTGLEEGFVDFVQVIPPAPPPTQPAPAAIQTSSAKKRMPLHSRARHPDMPGIISTTGYNINLAPLRPPRVRSRSVEPGSDTTPQITPSIPSPKRSRSAERAMTPCKPPSLTLSPTSPPPRIQSFETGLPTPPLSATFSSKTPPPRSRSVEPGTSFKAPLLALSPTSPPPRSQSFETGLSVAPQLEPPSRTPAPRTPDVKPGPQTAPLLAPSSANPPPRSLSGEPAGPSTAPLLAPTRYSPPSSSPSSYQRSRSNERGPPETAPLLAPSSATSPPPRSRSVEPGPKTAPPRVPASMTPPPRSRSVEPSSSAGGPLTAPLPAVSALASASASILMQRSQSVEIPTNEIPPTSNTRSKSILSPSSHQSTPSKSTNISISKLIFPSHHQPDPSKSTNVSIPKSGSTPPPTQAAAPSDPSAPPPPPTMTAPTTIPFDDIRHPTYASGVPPLAIELRKRLEEIVGDWNEDDSRHQHHHHHHRHHHPDGKRRGHGSESEDGNGKGNGNDDVSGVEGQGPVASATMIPHTTEGHGSAPVEGRGMTSDSWMVY